MRIERNHLTAGPGASRCSEGGSATVIFIALLAIMMILVTAEARALIHLRSEVKLLERQQIQRLNFPTTNSVASPATQLK